MAGLPNKVMGLLLPLLFATCVVRELFVHLTTLWSWRLVLARTFVEAHHLLSLCLSTTVSIIASTTLLVAFVRWVVPFAVAPFARWAARLETRPQEYGGFDGLQLLALVVVEGSLAVCFVASQRMSSAC